MSRILDSAGASLGSHYEEVLRVTLTNIWRHKLLVIAAVAGALVIGFVAALVMPYRYTAEAYVGGFATGNAVAQNIALDAAVLVETQARLLRSRQLARRVVERIGLERLDPVLGRGRLSSWALERLDPVLGRGRLSSWTQAILAIFRDSPRAPEYSDYQNDLAATTLLEELSAKIEPKTYIITLQYTAGDPELAALITNTFAIELLRIGRLQTLSQQRYSAQRMLEQLATLGEKHPKVIDAKTRLEAADALLKAEESKTNEEISRNAGGNVTFAQANAVPSSPNLKFIMGIALFVGLVGGIAIVAVRGPGLSPMTKLTKRAVDAAEIRDVEYFIWDEDLPGFGLRVLPNGRKRYIVQYRAGQRSRRVSLGPSTVLTCEQARTRAIGIIAAAKNDHDLASKRDAERQGITVKKRERFLSPAELRRVGEVLREMETEGIELPSAIAAARLLIFTGCCLGEIMTLKWDYVDMAGRALRLPNSKTGAKVIHLGQPAIDVLETIVRVENNPWVIAGTLPGCRLTKLQPFWQRVRARAGLKDVRINDLRHTFASTAVASGQGLPMIGLWGKRSATESGP